MFRQMRPESSETGSQFAARLRVQGNLCDFGSEASLKEHIRDHLVSTVSDSLLQKQLLSESGLTLDKTLELMRMHEATKSQCTLMTESATSSPCNSMSVHKIESPKRSTDKTAACTRCNRTGHAQSDPKCPARNRKCNKCHRLGHYAVCCRSKHRPESSSRSPGRAHGVSAEVSASVSPQDTQPGQSTNLSQGSEYALCHNVHVTHSDATRPPVMVEMSVCGKPMRMEVDTGANLSVIPLNLWESSCPTYPSRNVLCSFVVSQVICCLWWGELM